MGEQGFLVTVCIPAYNNAEYTRRTLESVLAQTYRPLRVVLIDDASPNSLEPLAEWFSETCDDQIDFKFIRNETNLIADTFYVFYREVGTDWVLQLHHDDRLVLSDFLAQCVQVIRETPDLVACYGNAITERGRTLMVSDSEPDWRVLDGPSFIHYMLVHGHTAWSSILYRAALLKDFSFPSPPFLIDNRTRQETSLDSDEGFSTFYLLAMRGDVAVTGQIFSERGEPATSYSRSSSWHTLGNSLFYIYYGVHLSAFRGRYANQVRKLALYSTLLYGLPRGEGFRLKTMRAAYPKSKGVSCAYVGTYLVTLFRVNRRVMGALLLLNKGDHRGFLGGLLTAPFYSAYYLSRPILRRLTPAPIGRRIRASLSDSVRDENGH
jgi:glycosyltransferase involved in cell wall biosynthesis